MIKVDKLEDDIGVILYLFKVQRVLIDSGNNTSKCCFAICEAPLATTQEDQGGAESP